MAQKKPPKKLYGVFYSFVPDVNAYLCGKMKGHKVKIINQPLTANNLDSQTEVLGVFVDSKVTKEILKKLPKLKLIVTLSTGYDHIELKQTAKRKIPVCNVPYYGENTVAEHTMALILALSRKIFPSLKRVKEGRYDYQGLRGFDLKGKTVGIIGAGHIGRQVIKMLKGFEVNILAFDVGPNLDCAKRFGFTYTTLPKLLASSDIISLHVPLLSSTRHLINKKNIKKIKPGAYLINTARGGLIEPEALVWGLETSQIAGAGLDVLEEEELISHPEKLVYSEASERLVKTSLMNNIIIDHPNTIVTPHNAFNSAEALRRIIDTTAENVRAFAEGKIQNEIHV